MSYPSFATAQGRRALALLAAGDGWSPATASAALKHIESLDREVGETLNRLQAAHGERDAAREALREATDLAMDMLSDLLGSVGPHPLTIENYRVRLTALRKRGGIDDDESGER